MCLLRHLKLQWRKLALTVLETGQMWKSLAWFLLSLHSPRDYRHDFWISLAPEASYACKYSFAALDDNSYASFILKYVVSRPVLAGNITISRVQGYFLSLLLLSVDFWNVSQALYNCSWQHLLLFLMLIQHLEFGANLPSLSNIPDAIACILFQHNSFWYHPFRDSL